MGKLGIDLWGLLWQLVAFGLLVYVLHRFLYKPTLRVIDERAEKVRRSAEDAERARRRAEEAEESFRRAMDEARRKSQEVIAEATRASQKVREEILEEAKQESARMIHEARAQIEAEQRQALVAVRDQVADLAVDIARRVLQNNLDEDVQRRLIDDFLAEAGNGDAGS